MSHWTRGVLLCACGAAWGTIASAGSLTFDLAGTYQEVTQHQWQFQQGHVTMTATVLPPIGSSVWLTQTSDGLGIRSSWADELAGTDDEVSVFEIALFQFSEPVRLEQIVFTNVDANDGVVLAIPADNLPPFTIDPLGSDPYYFNAADWLSAYDGSYIQNFALTVPGPQWTGGLIPRFNDVSIGSVTVHATPTPGAAAAGLTLLSATAFARRRRHGA